MSGSPVADDAPPAGARRVALVVAVTDYLDTTLRRLRAPAGDAAELRDVLADPEVGGFAVTSVVNERAHQLRVAIEDFLADRHRDDLLLVYLSCHGLLDPRGRLYFAARDTFKHRLASSGVESRWLLEQLEDCRARQQVVILDCCFSGAFARGAKGDDDLGPAQRLVGDGRGRVVLTASRSTEYSFEGEPVGGEDDATGSVFTSALVEGIRTGRADDDHDGAISVEDAYAYAAEQVRRAGTSQTPQRWLYGAEGSILLAHAPGPSAAVERPARPPRPAPPAVAAPGAATGRPEPRPRRRAALLALGAGAVVAAAAVVAVVLTQGTDDPGPSGGGDSPAGAFSQTSPWRLQLEDHTSDDGGGDDGCDLRLTGGDEAIDMPVHFFGTVTYQMRVSGSFRWDANRRGCLAVALPGRGPVYSGDFSWPSGTGDSAVFESPGTVMVRVTEEGRTSSCDLDLRSDVDGHSIRSKEVPADQSSVRFATDGPERVYLADVTCGVSVSTPDD